MIVKACEFCGVEFQAVKAIRRFCSRRCSGRSRPPPSPNRGNWKPGQTPWNKGLLGFRAGRKQSAETKARISAGHLSNGKPRVTPAHELVRKSTAYAEWRAEVFIRDNFACRTCGDRTRPGHRVVLHADHIKPFATHPELRLDVANGRTLCEPCHRRTPTYGHPLKEIK